MQTGKFMKSTELDPSLVYRRQRDEETGRVISFSLSYNERPCPLVAETTALCEQHTSYRGELVEHRAVFATPIGRVMRRYAAWGAGLECAGVDWTLV
jgi:hypothetical protein